jgi:hypothetical protein
MIFNKLKLQGINLRGNLHEIQLSSNHQLEFVCGKHLKVGRFDLVIMREICPELGLTPHTISVVDGSSSMELVRFSEVGVQNLALEDLPKYSELEKLANKIQGYQHLRGSRFEAAVEEIVDSLVNVVAEILMVQ